MIRKSLISVVQKSDWTRKDYVTSGESQKSYEENCKVNENLDYKRKTPVDLGGRGKHNRINL